MTRCTESELAQLSVTYVPDALTAAPKCDPVSGSTLTSSTGLKTRHFGTIISELTSCLRIHSECGSRLGGVSLEFTGELNEEGYSVTECLGGSMELSEEQLGLRYQVVSLMLDPRGFFSFAILRASAIPA